MKPPCRKPVSKGDIAFGARELIREICASYEVELVQGHIQLDHVHLLLNMPPQVSPIRIMQAVKGKSSHHLMQEFRRVQRGFGAGTFGTVAIL
jgi:putative transposase